MTLSPVLLNVTKEYDVSIQILAQGRRGGIALVGANSFMRIGHVKMVTTKNGPDQNRGQGFRTIWRWYDVTENTGEGSTKAKAISNMLAFSGFEAVPLTATIPDLTAGLM